MKPLSLLLIAVLAMIVTFAQKNKANAVSQNSTGNVQVLYSCPVHPDVTSKSAGKCSKCNMDLTLSGKEQMKREVTKTYTCRMHAGIVSDHAGTCPKCETKLVVDRKGSKQVNKVYTCTMHPDVKSSRGGRCPICNKPLTESNVKAKPKKT